MVPINFRQHRRELGLSQAALAGLIGCSADTVSNGERGTRPVSRFIYLRWCKALGMTPFLHVQIGAKEPSLAERLLRQAAQDMAVWSNRNP